MGTLHASRKTQTSDVSRRGGEARRGKSHCTKHRPQTRMFLALLFCPAAQQLLGLVTPQIQLPLSTKPLQYSAAII